MNILPTLDQLEQEGQRTGEEGFGTHAFHIGYKWREKYYMYYGTFDNGLYEIVEDAYAKHQIPL